MLLAAVLMAVPLAASLPMDADASWVQTAKLTAEVAPGASFTGDVTDRPFAHIGEDDWFGTSVSLSGDTLAVGAPAMWSFTTPDQPGEVHLYERDGLDWTPTTTLTTDVPVDNFGYSVALDQDTLVVGAPELAGGDNGGSAYVYERTASGWSLAQTLTEQDTSCFGFSVEIQGATVAVGAPCENRASTDVIAFIYERTPSGWSQAGEILATTIQESGSDLALSQSEDVLVVGAVGVKPWRGDSALVYELTDGTWDVTAVLPAQTSSVAISGSQIALGDRETDKVHIFEHGSGGWAQAAVLEAPPDGDEDSPGFGISVAFSGDGGLLAVGAWIDDPTPPDTPTLPDDLPVAQNTARETGAIHVYEMGSDGWTHTAKLSGSDAWSAQGTGERFGASVEVSTDGKTLIAGAPWDAAPWNLLEGEAVTSQHWVVESPCGLAYETCVYRGHEADAVYVFTHEPLGDPGPLG